MYTAGVHSRVFGLCGGESLWPTRNVSSNKILNTYYRWSSPVLAVSVTGVAGVSDSLSTASQEILLTNIAINITRRHNKEFMFPCILSHTSTNSWPQDVHTSQKHVPVQGTQHRTLLIPAPCTCLFHQPQATLHNATRQMLTPLDPPLST